MLHASRLERWPGPAGSARAAPLAFLAAYGIPAEARSEAERRARAAGVQPLTALLAEGLAEAETVYRALAAEAGLPFLDEPFAVHAQARFPDSVRSGIVPLAPRPDGIDYAYAPAGPAAAALLARRDQIAPGLAITTPERLRRAVFSARGASIAQEAAEALARARPDDSFRDGPTLAQLAAVFGFGALCMAALFLTPEPATILLAIGLGLPFLGLIAIKLASTLEHVPTAPRRPPPRIPDRDLPTYSLLVPLYREARVVPKLVRALRALDYPPAKLDVKLIVESGDDGTAAALAAADLPGFAEVIVAPPGAPRTKPRALNVALPLARGAFVVVYDAEDVPDPNQLRHAVAMFAACELDVACLQARLVIDNTADGWLPAFFTVDYGALFDVLNPALARFDLPVPLGGTSNHFRIEVLRELGGWDPWNVTEDADLAVRLAAEGYRVADLPSATLEEAPRTLRAWMAQRTRWMKGFVQVAITHSRRPVRYWNQLGPVRLFGAVAVTGGVVVSALVYPIFMVIVLAGLIRGDLLNIHGPAGLVAAAIGLPVLAGGLAAMIVPGLVAIARRGLWSLLPYALGMPLYYLLVSTAAWRGLYELARDSDRWNKTEHGLARTSRALTSGAPVPSPPWPVAAPR